MLWPSDWSVLPRKDSLEGRLVLSKRVLNLNLLSLNIRFCQLRELLMCFVKAEVGFCLVFFCCCWLVVVVILVLWGFCCVWVSGLFQRKESIAGKD